MNVLKFLARAAYAILAIIALLSAPVGAYFAYEAWQDPVPRETADNTGRAARTGDQALTTLKDTLQTQQVILAVLTQVLSESEKSRLGIDGMVARTERRLAEVEGALAQPLPQKNSSAGSKRPATGPSTPVKPQPAGARVPEWVERVFTPR